jgi:uncharacterized protein YndB with AHSA1/START domain
MPDIRHSIVIDAPPERIQPLISSAPGFSQWWAEDARQDGSDGAVELGFFNRATVYRLEPAATATREKAEWRCTSGKEWNGTSIVFDFTPYGGRTLLRFSHAGWQADTDYFVSCNTTWGELMFRLKAAAEGRAPGPLFSAVGLAY